MKITKRQLRKIITEEMSGASAQFMTDEQLMQEGLLLQIKAKLIERL